MKRPRSNPDARWEKLIRQAQPDVGPPANVPALLRVVREAPFESNENWAAEFSALFASARVVPACLGTASALALLATWQVWDMWQVLPWAELALGPGGVP